MWAILCQEINPLATYVSHSHRPNTATIQWVKDQKHSLNSGKSMTNTIVINLHWSTKKHTWTSWYNVQIPSDKVGASEFGTLSRSHILIRQVLPFILPWMYSSGKADKNEIIVFLINIIIIVIIKILWLPRKGFYCIFYRDFPAFEIAYEPCTPFRPCFHEVTVVRKIITQSECNFFSLPSLRETSDDLYFLLLSP